jgi:hypothetical protein
VEDLCGESVDELWQGPGGAHHGENRKEAVPGGEQAAQLEGRPRSHPRLQGREKENEKEKEMETETEKEKEKEKEREKEKDKEKKELGKAHHLPPHHEEHVDPGGPAADLQCSAAVPCSAVQCRPSSRPASSSAPSTRGPQGARSPDGQKVNSDQCIPFIISMGYNDYQNVHCEQYTISTISMRYCDDQQARQDR